MNETRIAKLFENGASQAVRLPVEFRFEGEEVYVTRDDATGDVVLFNRPGAKTWNDFFELLRSVEVPADFLALTMALAHRSPCRHDQEKTSQYKGGARPCKR